MTGSEHSARSASARRFSGPTVVSILSGKGGVGKSVIAFNLAERMASTGLHTLVIDTDIWCGNLHVLANVDSEIGLCQYLSGSQSLAETITTVNDRLDVITAGESDSGSAITFEDAAALIRRLRADGLGYDMIVLDHSSGRSEASVSMAMASDINALILVPELTSIADCYGLYKYLLQMETPIDCRLLLNRVNSMEEAEYIRSKFSVISDRFLGTIPGELGALEETAVLKQAVARQCPVSAVDSQAPVLQSLIGIIHNLQGGLATAGKDPVYDEEKSINQSPIVADTKG